MVVQVEHRHLIPFLAQHEENSFYQLKCSQHQEPPHLFMSDVLKAGLKIVKTFPSVSEAESKIMKFIDKPSASCNLKNVVDFDNT